MFPLFGMDVSYIEVVNPGERRMSVIAYISNTFIVSYLFSGAGGIFRYFPS